MAISPQILRGGVVVLDPLTAQVQQIIALQYNPDSLSRTLQIHGVGAEGGDRLEALRLKGPPGETFKLEAEIDATDLLAAGDSVATRFGIFPHLAMLETLIYPSSAALQELNRQADSGSIEIASTQAPLTLLIWSKQRVLPVRLTELSITEEAFDVNLNPIRAKISLGVRVLSVDDAGFASEAGSMFMNYLRQKEQLARLRASAELSALGLQRLP
jgi:hypothetical protein